LSTRSTAIQRLVGPWDAFLFLRIRFSRFHFTRRGFAAAEMQQLARTGIEGDGRPVNLPARRSGPEAGDRSRSVVSSNDRPVGHNQESARCNAVPYQRLDGRLGVAHPAKTTIACD